MSDPREDDMACGVVGLGEWWRRMGEYNGRRQGKKSGQQNNLRKKRETYRILLTKALENRESDTNCHSHKTTRPNHKIMARVLPHSVHISFGE